MNKHSVYTDAVMFTFLSSIAEDALIAHHLNQKFEKRCIKNCNGLIFRIHNFAFEKSPKRWTYLSLNT